MRTLQVLANQLKKVVSGYQPGIYRHKGGKTEIKVDFEPDGAANVIFLRTGKGKTYSPKVAPGALKMLLRGFDYVEGV